MGVNEVFVFLYDVELKLLDDVEVYFNNDVKKVVDVNGSGVEKFVVGVVGVVKDDVSEIIKKIEFVFEEVLNVGFLKFDVRERIKRI